MDGVVGVAVRVGGAVVVAACRGPPEVVPLVHLAGASQGLPVVAVSPGPQVAVAAVLRGLRWWECFAALWWRGIASFAAAFWRRVAPERWPRALISLAASVGWRSTLPRRRHCGLAVARRWRRGGKSTFTTAGASRRCGSPRQRHGQSPIAAASASGRCRSPWRRYRRSSLAASRQTRRGSRRRQSPCHSARATTRGRRAPEHRRRWKFPRCRGRRRRRRRTGRCAG